MNKQASNNRTHRQQGFTLIEVLIAMVLLAIGLLSMAQMQVNGLRANHSAYLRSQATILAGDILDSMRANNGDPTSAFDNGDYDTSFSDNPSGTATIAANDIDAWLTDLSTLLPNGDGAITRAGSTVSVFVRWNDSRQNEAATTRTFQVDSTL